MKGQDILLLFKLISIEQQLGDAQDAASRPPPTSWRDWEAAEETPNYGALDIGDGERGYFASLLSLRGLADETGISKTEVSQALKRSYYSGLAKSDRESGVPKTNRPALLEFVVYGMRYVFPVKPAEVTRGIATGFAAPILSGRLMTAGELAPVWPDAHGNSRGQAVSPLFKSVPFAVRRDPRLYEYLALTDAVRMGQARERKLASELLETILLRER